MNATRQKQTWWQRLMPLRWREPPPLPEPLWQDTRESLPFLRDLSEADARRLGSLCARFLQEKEFLGAHELVITDGMALSIAAQACWPLLYLLGPNGRSDPVSVLNWYGGFVGIVVQPGAVIVNREQMDASGVVHRYREVLAGEAMDGGPIMLSWDDVSRAAELAEVGCNVVIHEFIHKMDMLGMAAGALPDGAPPIHQALWGHTSLAATRAHWQETMSEAYARFRESLSLADRFGGDLPWLDRYAAQDPAEFFAVTAEAYFVNRNRFGEHFPDLLALYDGFFQMGRAGG